MNSMVAIFSSARRNSNTLQLLQELQRLQSIDIIFLDDYRIAAYDYQHSNSGDQFHSILDHLLAYDDIIFASPVYWSSVTPQMKAFYDRFTDLLEVESYKQKGRQLRGKRAYLLSSSTQSQLSKTFLNMHKEIFSYLGLSYQGCLHADCSHGYIKEKYSHELNRFSHRLDKQDKVRVSMIKLRLLIKTTTARATRTLKTLFVN